MKETLSTESLPCTTAIQQHLKSLQDIPYRDFQRSLIPNIDPERILGVRTPILRAYAKELYGTPEAAAFLEQLPHTFFEENQLHAFLLSQYKDFAACLESLNTFLPCIDNWATCDQLSPRIFRQHKEELLPAIDGWLKSEHTYTVRFAIGMLMQHFLDEDFETEYLQKVAEIRTKEYYINMEIAWYFATALAKQYQSTLPFLEEHRLAPWTHNKTIQKARESRRITPAQKEFLKTLKVTINR